MVESTQSPHSLPEGGLSSLLLCHLWGWVVSTYQPDLIVGLRECLGVAIPGMYPEGLLELPPVASRSESADVLGVLHDNPTCVWL